MEPSNVQAPARKSATAFRTISEVSEELDVPQHVLRFWETKFPQIRPLKRGGGRRYYRPEDVELLRRIRVLLYKENYRIAGVQRLLKEGRGTLPAMAPPPSVEERDGEASLLDLLAGTTDKGESAAIPVHVRREIGAVLRDLRALRDLLNRKP